MQRWWMHSKNIIMLWGCLRGARSLFLRELGRILLVGGHIWLNFCCTRMVGPQLEILTSVTANYTIAATYVKAAIADMKAYRDLMQYRKIPVGYSAGKRPPSIFAAFPSNVIPKATTRSFAWHSNLTLLVARPPNPQTSSPSNASAGAATGPPFNHRSTRKYTLMQPPILSPFLSLRPAVSLAQVGIQAASSPTSPSSWAGR